jgi:hypothetical protein
MKVSNILEVKEEALRLLNRIKEVEESDANQEKFNMISKSETTYTSKETGALKRSSMDLTRALSKMRNDVW